MSIEIFHYKALNLLKRLNSFSKERYIVFKYKKFAFKNFLLVDFSNTVCYKFIVEDQEVGLILPRIVETLREYINVFTIKDNKYLKLNII